MLGTTVTPWSGADGNGDGVVEEADYELWRANFGRTVAVGTNTLTSTIAAADPPVVSAAEPLAEAATAHALPINVTVENDVAPMPPLDLADVRVTAMPSESADTSAHTTQSQFLPLHDFKSVTRMQIADSSAVRHVAKSEVGSHDDGLVAWLVSCSNGLRHAAADMEWQHLRVNAKPHDRSNQFDDSIYLAIASLWG
jgi:hypothetical protein